MKRHSGGRFEIRFLARALAVAGTVLAVSVCGGEQGSFGGTTGPASTTDLTGPAITVLTPTGALYVGAGDTIRVRAKAVDPSGIAWFGARLFVLDTVLQRPVTEAGDSTAYASRAVERQDSFKVVVPASLAPGAYSLHVFAVDSSAALNDSTSDALVVNVRDVQPPTGSFVSPAPNTQVVAGDSVQVRFRAQDLTGVDSVTFRGYSLRGSASLGTETAVLRFQKKTARFAPARTDTTVTRNLIAEADSNPETVYLEAVVWDVAGNQAVVIDSIRIVAGPFVRLSAPVAGVRHAVGTTLNVTVAGSDPHLLTYVGFVATGVEARAESVAVSPAAGTSTQTLAWAVPATAALGVDTLVPFATNAVGGRFTGARVLVAFADTVRPTVIIDTPAVAQLPVNVGDSVYVRVHVRDNRGVTQVVLAGTAQRGSVDLGTYTEVERFAPWPVTIPPTADTVITRYLRAAVPTDSTSEAVTITATATDSSGNSGSGTATIRIVSGPTLTIVRPVPGTLTSAGKRLDIEVQASDPNGVRLVGWRTTGVVTVADSQFYSASGGVQPKAADFIATLSIPTDVLLGTFTITPFAVDSLGDPSGVTPGVTVTLQSAAADSTPPRVTFAVSRRIEATDSITVSATDASGVGSISWSASLLGTPATVYGSGTTGALPGTASDVRATFAMNLVGITRYPTQVVVLATAKDSSGAKTGTAVAETLTVVAGRTFALPGGSNIGDAIYNPNRGELYLSNTALNRIEVFDVATSSFVASIPVGSRPVGLALWPSDTTTRANADTLIVANSGGTNLSIVDLVTRVEKQRYRLPNYVIQKVKAENDPATGSTRLTITEYDYSDRPQYVAAVCRSPGPRANCGHVIALYSTTPTPGQVGYPGRGYLAWENLTSTATDGTKGHFFWEQAAAAITLKTDTLQIIAVRDSVPGTQVRSVILGAGVGQIVDFDQLQFQDSTFVRNSGNYLRALVAEGGTNQGFARVMAFDPTPGTMTITAAVDSICVAAGLVCTGTRDRGISDGVFVRDFIVNRASGVSSIAINQNGRTMLVRADSIYAFNQTLGQTGLMRAGSGAVGMDFHPSNNFDANTRGTGGFGGTGSPNNRLVFAARPDSSIDVFDTFFYGEVTDNSLGGATIPVPIRNSLIGPVRAATRGGNTLLFGLTAYGLVQVQLPSITNSLFPTAGLRADALAPASVPRIVSSGTRSPSASGATAPRSGRDLSPPRE